MTQVASLAAAAGAMPEVRSLAGAADAALGDTAGRGEFNDIFEQLGGKGSEAESSGGKAEGDKPPAEAKANRPVFSPGAGLHRLLASERLAPAQARMDGVTDDGAEGSDADMPAEAGRSDRDAADAMEAGDPPQGPAPVPAAPMAAAIAAAMTAVKPAAAGEAGKPEAADAEPDETPRSVIIVRPEAEDGTPVAPVRVPVMVERVETHFAALETIAAPVAEAVSAGSMQPMATAGRVPSAVRTAAAPVAKAAGIGAIAEDEAPADGDAGDGAAKTGPAAPRAAVSAAAKVTKPETEGGRAGGQAPIARGEAPAAQAAVSGLPAATVSQIGHAIQGAARDMTEQAAAAPAQDSGEISARAVVKVLNIRLDPPEYGSVAVRLTLQGGTLSVQLRAERDTTAAALDHDREKLAEHLKASGYGTDVSMIDTRRDMAVMRSDGAAGGNGGTGNPGGAGSGAAQAGGGQSPGDGGAMRRDGGNGGGQGPARGRDERRDGAAASDTGAGGLYV